MKRFYKLVSLLENQEGFEIQLDGKPIKTPSAKALIAPNETIASLIQKEWSDQVEIINSDTMPATQMITTCIDRVAVDREEMHKLLIAYLDTDLLCYRAPEPPEIKKRQAECWDIWLNWFENRYGLKLKTTEALIALKQPEEAQRKVEQEIRGLPDLNFTILQLVTSLSGSIILGLAFINKQISPDEILKSAHVEEDLKAEIYNAELYGEDPMQEKQRKSMIRDLTVAENILT